MKKLLMAATLALSLSVPVIAGENGIPNGAANFAPDACETALAKCATQECRDGALGVRNAFSEMGKALFAVTEHVLVMNAQKGAFARAGIQKIVGESERDFFEGRTKGRNLEIGLLDRICMDGRDNEGCRREVGTLYASVSDGRSAARKMDAQAAGAYDGAVKKLFAKYVAFMSSLMARQ